VIWGGGTSNEAFADGAAYDPAANTWRTVAASPMAGRFAEGYWSGKELLYWGGEDWKQVFDDGAAYDPATDRWRPLAQGPLTARVGTARVWSGRELVIWGGTPGTFNNYFSDGAAYDPATDRWHRIPSWTGRFASGIWTGREMLVWGGIVPTGAPGKTVEIRSAADGRRFVP
jgi:N-acetylneuraminic acid mutarotase